MYRNAAGEKELWTQRCNGHRRLPFYSFSSWFSSASSVIIVSLVLSVCDHCSKELWQRYNQLTECSLLIARIAVIYSYLAVGFTRPVKHTGSSHDNSPLTKCSPVYTQLFPINRTEHTTQIYVKRIQEQSLMSRVCLCSYWAILLEYALINPFHPVLPQWHLKDPGHSAKRTDGRLHLNTCTPFTQRSRSGLVVLSRYSVWT